MSIPYFPLYPDDFEADTAHLSLAEDGAYNRLLRLSWRSPECKLPDDLPWLFRRLRAVSEGDQATVKAVIKEFFVRKGGKVWNPRLLAEYVAANEAHQRRILAGSQGGKAKARKIKENEASNALAKPYQPEPYPELIKKEANASQKRRGTRLPDDWFLPSAWGQWAVAEGHSEQTIRTEAENFRDYWHSRAGPTASKLDWEATWRVWMRKAPKGNGHRPNITAGQAGQGRDRFLDEIAVAARARPAQSGFGH